MTTRPVIASIIDAIVVDVLGRNAAFSSNDGKAATERSFCCLFKVAEIHLERGELIVGFVHDAHGLWVLPDYAGVFMNEAGFVMT